MKFECDIIDCYGYNDVRIIEAESSDRCIKILYDVYHVKKINHIYCLNDYQ